MVYSIWRDQYRNQNYQEIYIIQIKLVITETLRNFNSTLILSMQPGLHNHSTLQIHCGTSLHTSQARKSLKYVSSFKPLLTRILRTF
jgi:hypothetical protein